MAVVQYTVSVKRPWTLSVGLEDRSVCMYIWGLYLLLSVPTDRRQVFISYKMKCEGEKRRGHSNELRYPWYYFILKSYRDFSLVVQWLRFCLQCRVCRFNPWSGSWDPTCLMAKKTKTLCKSSVVTNSIKTLKRAHIKKKKILKPCLLVSSFIYF